MNTQALHIPLRIVFYREDGSWVAHCLEFDLVGSGATKDEAAGSLLEIIAIQVEDSLQHDNPANLFFPAPGKYFEMFARGTKSDKVVGEAKLQFGHLIIDDVQAREFSDSNSALEYAAN